MLEQTLLIEDKYLEPYKSNFENWEKQFDTKWQELCEKRSLKEFASGYLYFGLHYDSIKKDWIVREWAPNANKIFLVGDFSNWKIDNVYSFVKKEHGVWELRISDNILKQGDLYSLWMSWDSGEGKRIPAWATEVVQDPQTHVFNARVSSLSAYDWKSKDYITHEESPIIYEAHVGMAGESPNVHSYREFTTERLLDIRTKGYNTIQLMAVQEHPYYGSFGYHVSSFFAPSSRFGSKNELKELIDKAHELGLNVIMDLVHSHAVKNEIEGIAKYDGTQYQFFHDGVKGRHDLWDSLCFNYSKPPVIHFLLSNIRYWLDEFHFDGFRFDGVTSMLYENHGLGKSFTSYADYFNDNLEVESIVYLKLANQLISEINSSAITIAEEMSALPILAYDLSKGGIGFKYRLSMGVPDLWIKVIKEWYDGQWDLLQLFYALTSHRSEEKVITYSESHDQALVGDQTLFFRMVNEEIYTKMRKDQYSEVVNRAISLHKMIRVLTFSTAQGGYLNFMGNEFGHPEWIDFPREGNQWSYQHARRIWSISKDPDLKFEWLSEFDKEMLHILKGFLSLEPDPIDIMYHNHDQQLLVYRRADLVFVFNFHPHEDYDDLHFIIAPGKYNTILSSDLCCFGGREKYNVEYPLFTIPEGSNYFGTHELHLSIASRSVSVLKKQEAKNLI